MKRIKQILSVLLAVIMAFTAVPLTASATIEDWEGKLLNLKLYQSNNNEYHLVVEDIPNDILDSFYNMKKSNNNYTLGATLHISTNNEYTYEFLGIYDDYRNQNDGKPYSLAFVYHPYEFYKPQNVTTYVENGNNGYNIVYVINDNKMLSGIKTCSNVSFSLDYGDTSEQNKGGGVTLLQAYIKDIDLTVSEKEEAPKQNISTLDYSKVSSRYYSGKEIKPGVTIKDGNYKLVKGTDYTISYKNNTEVGKATITIKGKGDYTGTKTLSFNILPRKTTLKVSTSGNKTTLRWGKVSEATKYEIYYSVNGGSYKKLTTVSGNRTTVSVKNLDTKNKSYSFKIRSVTVVNGKTYRSPFSKVVKIGK